MNSKIAIVIYANPDHYPPIINAITILSKEFDILLICRNQDKPFISYPENIKVYRLGKLETAEQKQNQNLFLKIKEYILFILKTIFLVNRYKCKLIYAYDMYGLVAGFFASKFIKKIPLVYHNLDMLVSKGKMSINYIVKYLELKLAHFAEKIVFCDINRAKHFQNEAKLNKLPHIVMNTPLKKDTLAKNKLKDILEKRSYSTNTKVILYQGRIGEGKALWEVLKSINLWPGNTVLLLMGYLDRDFAKKFFRQTRLLKVDQRIIYLGFISYKEIFNYTVGAYLGLGLYDSLEPNWVYVAGASNKIFEYISMGIPPIVNDSVYFRDIFDESFVYFANPFSSEDIARVINLAVSDYSGYQKKASLCRKLHLEKFNYEFQFKPILEFIKSKIKS
jgi:glycosyltransferase involved in cell wall biosynthesis